MNDWLDNLAELLHRDEPCVLLTVAAVRGSAPRETGAKMIVTATETIGTIGGGQLEYKCTQIAADNIRRNKPGNQHFLRKFPLGSNCGQCCGGVVDVMFERIGKESTPWLQMLQTKNTERTPVVIASAIDGNAGKFLITAEDCVFPRGNGECSQELLVAARALLATNGNAIQDSGFLLEPICESNFHIAVFGAGHVGAATVDALSRLDAKIRWIDNRKRIFPPRLAANVTSLESADPAREVAAMPAGSYYLVMTHSHPLDLDICNRILYRNDFSYCGLIGSLSKRRRFERLLRKQGITDESLRRLVCPIGISGIAGKKPAEIALSVAAEVLRTRDALHNVEHARHDVAAGLRVV
jgi:xanthine dehydrogenase accessory factor